MKNQVKVLAVLLILLGIGLKSISQHKPHLKHDLTEEEKKLMPSYLEDVKIRTKAAPAPEVRNIAEFDHMSGVLIGYPLGLPLSFVAEVSEDDKVYTIVSSQNQKNNATNEYSNGGVNLSNCEFIIASTDSYWTRDYGPWFVTYGNDQVGVVNFTYNRPRYNDNQIPSKVADYLGIQSFDMDITTAGGNYMTDGMGVSVSTDLLLQENSGKSQQEINNLVKQYLGIDTYHLKDDPTGLYVQHVDCWSKFLDVDKIMIAQVPQSNYNYSKYEAMADFFANQTSSYGNKYQVYRVNCPNGQPYTNSLIINKKVYIPTTGSSADSDAISSYQQAMPGYEVIGIQNYNWDSSDALHCRTHEMVDKNMLYIDHMPILGEVDQQNNYTISADVIAYSGQSVTNVTLNYKVNNGSYQMVNMSKGSGNQYAGIIPSQSEGSQISYYIHALDQSGRSMDHPYINSHDPHVFTIGGGTTGCSIPSNIQVLNITQSSADVSWNTVSTSISYGIRYRKTGTINYSEQNTTTNSISLENLTLNTQYELQVRTNCSGETSSWSSNVTFTTKSTQPADQYCASKGVNQQYEWITEVKVGSFTNSTGKESNGYGDYTSKIINLTAGENTDVILTPNNSNYTEAFKIWIDYNHDFDFTDSGEEVLSGSASGNTTGTINIPVSASGTTRMRVSMNYNTPPASPCGDVDYGEVEDYTVSFEGSIPDTEAPSVPSGLTSSNITQTSVDLSWNASTDNIGVMSYDVYNGSSLATNVSTTNTTISGLTPNTRYSFSVKAKDAAGNESGFSNTITVVTKGNIEDTEPPSIPTGLKETGVTHNTINLSWNASTDNVGVTGYDIFQDEVQIGTSNLTSYKVTGLSPVTTYNFKVRAKDLAGNQSGLSVAISVTTSQETITYCTSKGQDSSYEWIAGIQIGSFTKSSGNENGGYSDFTSEVIMLTSGESVNINLTPGFSGMPYSEYWKIWIDYNKDGDFVDAGEEVYSGNGSNKMFGSFTVSSIVNGDTRLRASMKYESAPTSCESFSYGEVEDYTVSFIAAKSTNSLADDQELIIYPNPTDEVFYIKLTDIYVGEVYINTFNVNGLLVDQKIKEKTDDNIIIDMAIDFPGIYNIQVVLGKRVLTKSIIIE